MQKHAQTAFHINWNSIYVP